MAISIALTKGRLEENAVMLMEKAGFGSTGRQQIGH